MLSEECTTIEDNIKLHQQVLGELQSDIRLAERRVKGLTTMVSNLEKQKTEKETLLSAAEYNLKENKGNAAELAIQIQMLEKELQGIIRQLADKQEKLQTADRQLIELKKDMGAIAMTYGYIYVAQVSIGANQNQYFQAIKEAEAYPGPSLIIAYAPCINHGIKGGMTRTQTVGKEAVACGYWQLWRYNPMLEEQGKNPFSLDSKEPDWSKFREFILKEVRYSSLTKLFPAEADELFAAAEENAQWRYNTYKRYAAMNFADEKGEPVLPKQ